MDHEKKDFCCSVVSSGFDHYVGCNHESNPKAYQLDYYMDTIQGHVIISAVCVKSDGNGISVSSVNVGTTRQSKEKGYYGEETEF